MTKNEASELAMRIMQTWRGGPSALIWEEILEPLHQRQATVTYERLRMGSDTAPSIRQFVQAYNALTATTDDNGAVLCQGCDGYGWNTVTETHHGIDYTASKPCTYCDRGKDNKTTVDKINAERRAA